MTRPGFSYVIVLLITWGSLTGVCQQPSKIDSLKSVLRHQTGNDRFKTLNRLAVEFTDVDNKEAYRYARELYPLSLEMGDSLKITQAGLRMASVLRRLEKADSALLFLDRFIPIARRHSFSRELKYLTNGAGLVYLFQARYRLALSMFIESLELRKLNREEGELGVAFANIAMTYYKMKNYHKAMGFFEEAIKYGDAYNFANLLINRGLCMIYLGREEEGIGYIQHGLSEKSADFLPDAFMNGYTGLGIAYFRLQNYALAQKYLEQAFAFARKQKNQRFMVESLVYLSKIHVKNGKVMVAAAILGKAETIARYEGYHELLITIYEDSVCLFTMLSDPRLSKYLELLIQLKHEIYTAELRENLLLVEADFRNAANLTSIANQRQTLSMEYDITRAKNKVLCFLFVLGFIGVVTIFQLYYSFRLRKRLNVALELDAFKRTEKLEQSVLMLRFDLGKLWVSQISQGEILKRHVVSLHGISGLLGKYNLTAVKEMQIKIGKINV